MSIDPLLLTAVRVLTFNGSQPLTNASGFFFARDGRVYLVTSRHVVWDGPSGHFPDRIEIELHMDSQNMAESVGYSILLYDQGRGVWRQGADTAGDIDIALIEIDPAVMPEHAVYRAFTPKHVLTPSHLEIGTPLLIVGFPLGFHDRLHHMPVARQGIVASSFGLRFEGQGYFLTDARTHRGMSGAPVVARIRTPEAEHGDLPWRLLGIHSARLDVGMRDLQLDEALGLNCAWYADALGPLSDDG